MALHQQPKDDREALNEFSTAEVTRAGIGAGLVLGVVLGGTLWTHTPDVIHLGIALAIVAFCMLIGGLIGRVVSGINTEQH